jgi:hypothetical protein
MPALLLAAALLAAPARAAVTIEPPPGWENAVVSKDAGDVVASLKGPETSSFVLAKVAPMKTADRGVIRAFLIDVLASVNQKTGLGFTLSSNLASNTYDNGFTLYSIHADYQGKPRLVLGVVQVGDMTLLATLISSVPDTILPEIMGGLKGPPVPSGPSVGGKVVTLDEQLAFDLPEGLVSRPVAESERKLNFVLAVRGLDSEIMLMKLVDDTTAAKDQPVVVRDTVLSLGGVDKASVSELSLLKTQAGPELVFAWAHANDSSGAGSQFAAGYMPWGYWGYSAIAKGPRAADLMTQLFKQMTLGPGAQPKLVEATPRVPLPSDLKLGGGGVPLLPAAAVVVAALVILVVFLNGKRRA